MSAALFVGLQIYEVVNNAEARKRVTCFSEAAHSMCGNSRFGDAICLFDVAELRPRSFHFGARLNGTVSNLCGQLKQVAGRVRARTSDPSHETWLRSSSHQP